jgi:hypothetical protein
MRQLQRGFEKWAGQRVAIFATAGESNKSGKGCGKKASRKGKIRPAP